MAVKDWPGAIASLAKIRDLDPAYRDVAALLRQADIEKDRAREAADLLSLGKRMAADGNWQGAAPVFQQALDLAPDHDGGTSLLAEANARIEQERAALSRQTFLAGAYDAAADKMAQKDWAGAIESLETLEGSEPGYRDVKNLLEQARTENGRREQIAGLVASGREYLAKGEWPRVLEAFSQHAGTWSSERPRSAGPDRQRHDRPAHPEPARSGAEGLPGRAILGKL